MSSNDLVAIFAAIGLLGSWVSSEWVNTKPPILIRKISDLMRR